MKLSYVEMAAALDEVAALVRDCKFVPVQKLQHVWDARDHFAALALQAQPTRDVQRAYDVARDVWGATNVIEAVVDALLAQENAHE